MKLTIIKEGCGTWEECANLIINTKKGDIFSNNGYSDGIGIYDWCNSEKTTAIGNYFANRKFLERIKKTIDIGLAEVEPEPEKRSDNAWRWVIGLKTELFTFPTLHIPLERENVFVEYGKCKEIPAIEIVKSERFRPSEWYEGVDFGNKFNGGTKYYYEGNAPIFKLKAGYEIQHKSCGSIDGWGSGFKGGSYIVKKQAE